MTLDWSFTFEKQLSKIVKEICFPSRLSFLFLKQRPLAFLPKVMIVMHFIFFNNCVPVRHLKDQNVNKAEHLGKL